MWAGLFGQFNFQDIDSALNSPGASLESVLELKQIQPAFKRQYGALISYLTANLLSLTKIALGISDAESQEVVANALFCLTNPAPVFSSQLSTNRKFVAELNTFITTTEEPTSYNLIAFTRIMEFLVLNSNGFVFVNFPDKVLLMKRFIKFINNSAMFGFLTDIFSNASHQVVQFLESVDATKLLFEELGGADDHKILTLIGHILESRCNSTILFSPILSRETVDRMEKFIESGVEAILAADILFRIVKFNPDYTMEDEHSEILDYIRGKVDTICALIMKDESYTRAKNHLMMVIVHCFMDSQATVPDSIIGLAKFTFDLVFKHETSTILHNDFLALFQTMWQKLDLLNACGIMERVPDAFRTREENTTAGYWGLLYTLAELVHNKSSIETTEKWNQFIEEVWTPMDTLIHSSYGGTIAKNEQAVIEVFDASSDSDYEEEYVSEYEEEYEEDA